MVFFWGLSFQEAYAQKALLVHMETSSKNKSLGIDFEFTSLPQYKVNISGQKVEFIMYGTSLSPQLERIDDHANILQTNFHEGSEKSTVSLILRSVPKDVNSSTSMTRPRVHLEIVWSASAQAHKPAIASAIESRLNFDNHKTSARRYIASTYSENWLKFFENFEWPIALTTSRHFCFPDFPCYLKAWTISELEKSILEYGYKGYWNKGLEMVNQELQNASSKERALLTLIKADLLVRQGEFTRVKKLTYALLENDVHDILMHWATYIRCYALAVTGDTYTAYYDLEKAYQYIDEASHVKQYYRILLGELALSTGHFEKALELFSQEEITSQNIYNICRLRKADALFELGQKQKAYELYQSLAPLRYFWETHPWSLASLAKLNYTRKQYDRACQNFFLLNKAISSHREKSMALYWAAMARYRGQKHALAHDDFQNIEDMFPDTEGALRSRLKLNDLKVLQERSDWQSLFLEYQKIVQQADTRNVREEATFKKILMLFKAKKKEECVICLEQFLRNYCAGKLKPHAEALMVEVLPEVVRKLVAKKQYFQAMVLVEKNRQLLIHSPLSLQFLTSLAKAFFETGLFDRAEKVYSYVLAGSDSTEVKDDIFLLLIETLFEKKEMDRVVECANSYCQHFPKGKNLVQIYLFKAKALQAQEKDREALRVMLSKDRPVDEQLDIFTGELLFDLNKYKQVEKYMSRGMDPYWQTAQRSILLLRAEALYKTNSFQNALTYYSYLIQHNHCIDQSLYRKGCILYKTGQHAQSFQVLKALIENGEESYWKRLAKEFLALHQG
jgi:tetratricopeptide (TPR) repeat protein